MNILIISIFKMESLLHRLNDPSFAFSARLWNSLFGMREESNQFDLTINKVEKNVYKDSLRFYQSFPNHDQVYNRVNLSNLYSQKWLKNYFWIDTNLLDFKMSVLNFGAQIKCMKGVKFIMNNFDPNYQSKKFGPETCAIQLKHKISEGNVMMMELSRAKED